LTSNSIGILALTVFLWEIESSGLFSDKASHSWRLNSFLNGYVGYSSTNSMISSSSILVWVNF
jgi:hypothetical protein